MRRPPSSFEQSSSRGRAARSFEALFALLSLFAAVGATVWAAPAWAANYRLEIDAPSEVVAQLREHTLLGRWIDEPGFTAEQLPLFVDLAREEAVAIVRDAGYFAPKVKVVVEPGELKTVRLTVDAGPRTTVAGFELRLDGPPAAKDMRARLLERWPLPEGSFFRPSAWEQAKRVMLDALQENGFARARVESSEARVDVQATSAILSLHIDAGPQLTFGPMEVSGLERYDRSIVEALKPWSGAGSAGSDQPYSFSQLLLFQERLRDSGYFSGVDVLPDLDAVQAEPKRTDIPIKVVLRELRRQRVNFGIGYSSDEGARALLGYEHRDFLGRGLQLESGLLFQSVSRRVFASVRTPQDASDHFYQVGARIERLEIQNELTDRQTLFAGRGKHGEEIDSFLSLQYQTEQRTVPLDPSTDHRKALTLGYSWNLRRVDSRIDPRRGYTISAQASGAARGLLSDRSFARAWTRAMHFWPMPPESALNGGLLVGLVEVGQVFATSREGIPTENLFRTGGTQSIRGYSFLSLGVPEGGAIVGGRVLGVASLEYQHPIVRDWYGAVFLDAGNAADSWSDWKAVYGTGVGVRWRSPVGPVSVDMAWGEATHKLRFHLSVGYAF
jgi:translocation and assembly module TamA